MYGAGSAIVNVNAGRVTLEPQVSSNKHQTGASIDVVKRRVQGQADILRVCRHSFGVSFAGKGYVILHAVDSLVSNVSWQLCVCNAVVSPTRHVSQQISLSDATGNLLRICITMMLCAASVGLPAGAVHAKGKYAGS